MKLMVTTSNQTWSLFFTMALVLIVLSGLTNSCSSTSIEQSDSIPKAPDKQEQIQDSAEPELTLAKQDQFNYSTKIKPLLAYPLSGDAIIGPPFSFMWNSSEPSFDVQLRIEAVGAAVQVLRFQTDKNYIRVGAEQGLIQKSSYQSVQWTITSKNSAFSYQGLSNQILAFPQTLEILKSGSTISFEMGRASGSNDERPKHQVTLSQAFSIASEPINNLMLAALTNRMLSQDFVKIVDDRVNDLSHSVVLQLGTLDKGIQHGLLLNGGRLQANSGYEQHPAVGITWHGARFLIAEINRAWDLTGQQAPFALPSEAEWELAASLGIGASNPWFGALNGELANYERSRDVFEDLVSPFTRRGGPTAPVNFYLANRQRVWRRPAITNSNFSTSETWRLQMIGNVWEWCSDWYGEKTYSRVQVNGTRLDPLGPSRDESVQDALEGFSSRVLSKVVRGGAWDSLASNLYAQKRGFFAPEATSQSIGFRLIAKW